MKTFIFLCSIAFALFIYPGDAIYCAYYPSENQNDPMNPSQDEVMGIIQPDNVTIFCPEENDRCFSFWYTHPNYENEILIQKQGCWGNEARSLNCNQENCTAHSKPSEYLVRTKNQTSRICCCAGDYCNRNVSDAYVPLPSTKPTVTQYKVISDKMNYDMERTILIAVIPIFCVSVAIAIMYFIFRMRLQRSTKAQMSQLPMLEAPPPEPTFDLDQLKMMELVGQGRYCNVYRAALSEKEVAVKVFTGSSKQCYMNELDIMGLPHMEHSNLLQYVGSGDRMGEDGWVEHLLVVEMISRGSLMSYLRENSYDWHTMCRLAQTTAAGLAHLHQVIDTPGGLKPAVVHRDINSRNVLVNAEGNCVIGDFGFAMKVCGSSVVGEADGDNSTITDVGTVRYMSPEVLDGAVNLRDCECALKQVDVYALGLVIWEIAMRCKDLYPRDEMGNYQMPFEEQVGLHPTFEDMQVLVSRERKRPQFPDAWKQNSQALRSLKETIEDCWDHDAEARLTALCVEERIIELMVLWDKHHTVSPTINPTTQGNAIPTHTMTDYTARPMDIIATEYPGIARLADGTMIAVRSNGQPVLGAASDTSGTASDTKNHHGLQSSVSSGLEKNERLRLLSPDTISTSLSSQSDLNLIDLTASAPPVDPKNLHHSDDSIERYTTDLKYGPSQSGPKYCDGFSEPSTSPSRPLVVNEMRAGLSKDQMTDNLSHGMGKLKNKSSSMPSWNHMNGVDPRSRAVKQPVNKAKLDTNLHRQQARSTSPKQPNQNKYDASESSGASSEGAGVSRVSPNMNIRPNSLPLQSTHRGSKKKLMAVYIPKAGPTTKVQTGIAKMDSVAPSCHQVKMAANTHKHQQPAHNVVEKLQHGNAQNLETGAERPHSWACDSSSSSDHSHEIDRRNGNACSGSTSCIAKGDNGKRKGTPFRLLTEKLSIHKGKDKKDPKDHTDCNEINNQNPGELNVNNNAKAVAPQTLANDSDNESTVCSDLSNGHAGVTLNVDAYPLNGKLVNGSAKLQANFELECV
ncbi:bone morphogenetic protein receptor type-2-like [Lytechinus variegatus]|uniref:bone morphogenetic protein receptor type-2-like n=1 Tax=Lytechinus variegatus TaxID=7654 RepID=UPI001BB164EF|nr:bone morphogenetic protein receptor type-2-like [Lytechinus variegatus]XP_041459769.1 bone morphogenetic protein receptor type-2-like [Lytechinus variegatus]XP_041459770.1 bone morphogenetic protein receptor type-2-like [Lytechinus variegatus]